jgi:hypothetical protein
MFATLIVMEQPFAQPLLAVALDRPAWVVATGRARVWPFASASATAK